MNNLNVFDDLNSVLEKELKSKNITELCIL